MPLVGDCALDKVSFCGSRGLGGVGSTLGSFNSVLPDSAWRIERALPLGIALEQMGRPGKRGKCLCSV